MTFSPSHEGLLSSRQPCSSSSVRERRSHRTDHSCHGRDHAHQRIDLYPVEGLDPRTIIGIHVDRGRKAWETTTLLLGFEEPSIFPVASHLTACCGELLTTGSSLQLGSFRDDTFLNEPPERDHQLPRQGNNADLASAHTLTTEASPPPDRQIALRLVSQP